MGGALEGEVPELYGSPSSSPIGGVPLPTDSNEDVDEVEGGGLISLMTLRGPESDKVDGALLPMTEGEAVCALGGGGGVEAAELVSPD